MAVEDIMKENFMAGYPTKIEPTIRTAVVDFMERNFKA